MSNAPVHLLRVVETDNGPLVARYGGTVNEAEWKALQVSGLPALWFAQVFAAGENVDNSEAVRRSAKLPVVPAEWCDANWRNDFRWEDKARFGVFQAALKQIEGAA